MTTWVPGPSRDPQRRYPGARALSSRPPTRIWSDAGPGRRGSPRVSTLSSSGGGMKMGVYREISPGSAPSGSSTGIGGSSTSLYLCQMGPATTPTSSSATRRRPSSTPPTRLSRRSCWITWKPSASTGSTTWWQTTPSRTTGAIPPSSSGLRRPWWSAPPGVKSSSPITSRSRPRSS